MTLFTLKKTVAHLILCALLCCAVWLFSDGGSVFAGFMAGFLGAAYLLAAWMAYLRGRGKRLFDFFRREKAPTVPYMYRKEKESPSRMRFFRERHEYDDGGAPDADDDTLDGKAKSRCSALAFVICGAAMLCVSLFL